MIHIVHHPDYVTPERDGAHLFSKYGVIMDVLRTRCNMTEYQPQPMPRVWLEAAHNADYVEAVLSCTVPVAMERRIGFAITPAIAQRAQLSVGGTWLAAKLALQHGYAANTAGGSHHALPDGGAGYCVFNDLAITALRLIDEQSAKRILIVDCDVHQGDGTAAILAGHDQIATLSLHADKNFPARKTRSTLDVGLADNTGDAEYIAALEPALERMIDYISPDIILFQAGVDSHSDDTLGRLSLTDAGMAERDRSILNRANRHGIALASVMGGGYGRDASVVAARHAQTIFNLAGAHHHA